MLGRSQQFPQAAATLLISESAADNIPSAEVLARVAKVQFCRQFVARIIGKAVAALHFRDDGHTFP